MRARLPGGGCDETYTLMKSDRDVLIGITSLILNTMRAPTSGEHDRPLVHLSSSLFSDPRCNVAIFYL